MENSLSNLFTIVMKKVFHYNDNKFDVIEKICPKCGIVKNINEFLISRKTKDGLTIWCSLCLDEMHKKEWGKKQIKIGESYEIFTNNSVDCDVTKMCPECGIVKNINDFFKSNSTHDGLTTWCSLCLTKSHNVNWRKNRFEENENCKIPVKPLTNAESRLIRRCVNDRCEIPNCVYGKSHNVHHIVGRSEYGDHSYFNMIALCASHHKDADDHIILAEDLKSYIMMRNCDEERSVKEIINRINRRLDHV